MPSPRFILLGLLAVGITLATQLHAWLIARPAVGRESADLLTVLIGDSRRLFANHFFVKADVYLHRGYYPTIFDTPKTEGSAHLSGKEHEPETHEERSRHAGKQQPDAHADEENSDFLGPPKDWIDAFSRHFFPSRHSHLERDGSEREILPWLRIAAALDPHDPDTYVTAAFWLRERLGKVSEAEQFLREGLRANTNSVEILIALGRLKLEGLHDLDRARNLFELALAKWQQQEGGKPDPDKFLLAQIVANLALVEERANQWRKAISYLELLKRVSPHPDEVQKEIEEIKAKAISTSAPNPPSGKQ
jgi:tetratricopeptide (TPR) repeat protein